MKIGSISGNLTSEKRISLTPEISKKYLDLGVEIFINKSYGTHLGLHDNDYKEKGVQILNNIDEVINNCNSLLQVNLPEINYIEKLRENTSLIGVFNPYDNKEKIDLLLKKKIDIFSLDLLPRIARAQSMDVLSSQANLAGYKAVIESFDEFEKVIPMMMTAAGTIPAAKVLVIGAGVAGLQAISTAKRLGAIVFATDVRQASKEQVESLGGKFLSVEGAEDLETKEGYAKETGEEFKLKQQKLLSDTLKKIDIVICTALIPGKKAPRIINEEMFKDIQAGSIIFDLAVEQGGNSAYSEIDKVVNKNGVKIIGYKNILNKLPLSATNLYSKNLYNFFLNLYDKEKKNLSINLEDEIINKTLIENKNI
ncbi:MAG TPA: NAD(P) transhydrogenase subunit alpha [Pelagibacteraceae bacterium]|jgi:NAD(P) transhydrogenase subunit alpha|nr:NAD(P) transhydrogenase subunit alpha [Pelagibacteraceae bacterium]